MKKRIIQCLLFCALLSGGSHSIAHPTQLELDFNISAGLRAYGTDYAFIQTDMSVFSRYISVNGFTGDASGFGHGISGSCFLTTEIDISGVFELSCFLTGTQGRDFRMVFSFSESFTVARGRLEAIEAPGGPTSTINATNITFQ